jgi:Zn-dependent peptidase ImmA (M78 family)/DNA-binding XRE family transcriptional regulator
MFNPERLSLARRRRGLTKKSLAEALAVTPHTVLRYEQGDVTPPATMLDRLAACLAFPIEFFMKPDFDEPQMVAVSFRSMAAMTARERDAALAAGALAFELSDWVGDRFHLPECNLLDLSGEAPEAAARSLRQKWGLGEKPIKNMVRLFEANGIRIFSLVENTRTVDAFSLWRKNSPYVFLNTIKTPEHSRFDAAHELGHLVLHKHGGPTGRKAEEEANRFASSFLMPRSDVLAQIPRARDVNQIIGSKRRWGVSAVALNYRLHKIGATSDWLYRQFCIQLTERGYRESEPCSSVAREQSAIWQKVFDAFRSEGVTKQDIAKSLHFPASEVENLVFGLANMLTVDGGARSGSKSRANLRVVAGGGSQ